jgi:hypothetical protein
MKQEKVIRCIGITNRLQLPEGPEYVVFLDYDNRELEDLKVEVEKLATKWGLGWTYIISSKEGGKNWHVISPVMMSVYEYLGVLWDSKCDKAYKTSFFTFREKTLRVSSKPDGRKQGFPKLKCILPMNSDRVYSSAHLKFLMQYHKAKTPIEVNIAETKLEAVSYGTIHNALNK